ncbi:MAG: hypothetical protein RLZ14_1321 [Actinomycetota bacterium]|jgi:hypothetical protein
MIKRLVWFVGGAVAGIAGASVARKKVREVAVELAPANVAKKATSRVREAVSEGRRAMKAKEAELRSRLDGGAHSLADDLDDGDTVMVDGVPVEPGQVIVLKQVRDDRSRPNRRRPPA